MKIKWACLLIAGFVYFSAASKNRKDIGLLTPERTCYDALYYRIQVSIDPKTKSIKGQNRISFRMVRDASLLRFDYSKNMHLEKLLFENANIKFRRDKNAIVIDFKEALKKDSFYSIDFYFDGHPKIAILPPWQGGFVWKKDKEGFDWVGLACESLGASAWLPCKDHWSDEVDSMDIFLEVPNHLIGVSNGQLINSFSTENQTKVFHWKVQNPINNYNISINVGHYTLLKDTFHGIGFLPLNYYVLEYNMQIAEKHFVQVHGMLKAFEYYFGRYPFYKDSYKLVETPYWGMEHQSCIAYGNNYINNTFGFDFIIIHESGHEWFANSITAFDPADQWIHESFTTYAESLYLEFISNKTVAIEYLLEQKDKIAYKSPILGHRNVFYHDWKDSDMYYKGTWVLHTMRSCIDNDSVWFEALKEMNRVFYHQIVRTEDIIEFFNTNTGLQWQLFFNQYLKRKSIPELRITNKKLGNGKVEYQMHFKGVIKDLSIPIVLKASNHRLAYITLSKKVSSVILDSNYDLYAYLNAHYLFNLKY